MNIYIYISKARAISNINASIIIKWIQNVQESCPFVYSAYAIRTMLFTFEIYINQKNIVIFFVVRMHLQVNKKLSEKITTGKVYKRIKS